MRKFYTAVSQTLLFSVFVSYARKPCPTAISASASISQATPARVLVSLVEVILSQISHERTTMPYIAISSTLLCFN